MRISVAPRIAAWAILLTGVLTAGQAIATQYLVGSFNQQGNEKGGSSSEPSIAVGPYDVFVQNQGDLNTYAKSGGAPTYAPDCPHLFYETLGNSCSQPSFFFDGFCNGACFGGQAGDPVATYDPFSQRYYAACLSNLTGVTSHVHLAISRTNRLSDGWYVYHTETARPANCPFSTGVDRPIIGFSTDKIVLYANLFGCSLVRVFDKAALLTGQATQHPHTFQNATSLFHNDIGSQNYVDLATNVPATTGVRVCRNLSADPNVYILSLSGTTSTVLKISGTFPNVSTTTTTGTIQALGYPVNAEQKNGSPLLAAFGGVLPSEAVARNGKITVAWHEYSSTYAANAIRLLRLDANTAQPVYQETYGQSGMHYCYPAVTVDSTDDVFMGFDTSNSTTFPSCYITGRRSDDATLEVPTLIQAGVAPYAHVDGRGGPCWGDFTNISLDETVTPPTAYYVGQYTFNYAGPPADVMMASWVTSFYFQPLGGGGGGGCPTVEVQTDGGWMRQNTILHRSSTHEVARDAYRLQARPRSDAGHLRVRIREDEQEHTRLDALSLVAVDHAAEEATCMIGDRFYAGRLGSEWSLRGTDGATPLALRGLYRGEAGASLVAQPPVDGSHPTRGPVQITSVIKDEGGVRVPAGADAQVADAWVIDHTGIQIEHATSDRNWAEISRLYPRENEAEQWLPDPGDGPLRLNFVDPHSIRGIRQMENPRETAGAGLRLAGATHSRLGDVLSSLESKDGRVVDILPGDVLTLDFEGATDVAGDPDFYVVADGYYTSLGASDPATETLPVITSPTIRGVRPNPFAHTTSIDYAVPARTTVTLEIIDAAGRRIQSMVDGVVDAGEHVVTWDGRDDGGASVRAGVYFVRLRASGQTSRTRLVLLGR